jgi:TatD DNase family protein
MIIDTHSHVNFNAYKEDREQVVERTLADDVWMINVGTKYETSKSAIDLAEKYSEGVYAVIGLHPIYAAAEFQKIKTDPDEGDFFVKEQDFDKVKYRELAKSKKVVAIGEIGLDYYYKPKTNVKLEQFKEKQKNIFIEQLDFAKELNLPVMIHVRMAHEDVINILEDYKRIGGVIHCFTGTLEQAQKYIDLGFYIGINGIIFKFDINEVIKKIPLDKILIETDCPYLTPPEAGVERNEPIFVKYVAKRIAELKNITFDEVVNKTTENAKKLFKI